MFIGRKEELQTLNQNYQSSSSGFCVLYGRRRIGKSTLLEEFVKDKPSFFYLAGRENKRLQLRRFVRELGDTMQDPLTGKVAVSNWDEALELLEQQMLHLQENEPAIRESIKSEFHLSEEELDKAVHASHIPFLSKMDTFLSDAKKLYERLRFKKRSA